MGFFNNVKDTASEVKDAVVEMHDAAQLGQTIGKEAYRQGLQPGEMDWSTVETLAQQHNIRSHRDPVAETLRESINDGYAEAEDHAQAKHWWQR